MTITVVFGSDFVSTFAAIQAQQASDTCAAAVSVIGAERINGQQLPDTCALEAYTVLGTIIDGQEARDSCAIVVTGGTTIAMNLQQKADFGSIGLFSSPSVPNPNPILNPPPGAGFVAHVPVERYTVVVERSPATADEV